MSRRFFAINISSLRKFQREFARAQFCIDGTPVPLLGRAERSIPPEPGGSRRKARGLTAKARAERQWVSGRYAATRSAFLLILFPPLKGSDYVCSIDPRRSPFAMRHSPHQLISGRGKHPYQGPSCNSARAQGSKGGWDPSGKRHIAATWVHGHTSNLGISNIPFVSFRRF